MLYFFDSAIGETLFRDEIGTELESDIAAREEASEALAEMARQHIPGDGPQKNIVMWVRREMAKRSWC